MKTPNTIFARHLLATAKKEPVQSLDNFLLTLAQLSKDFNFANVTGEEYRKEMIRDAFINGISSHAIRQRLLKNSVLTLERAFEQARTLDSAKKSSEAYRANGNSVGLVASTSKATDVPIELPGTETPTSATATNTASKLCYFCGQSYHSRSNCPAKNSTCYKCDMKGHFAKVCKSKGKDNTDTNACLYTSNLCVIQPAPNCLSNATTVAVINGIEVSVLIDAGSSSCFVKESMARKLNLKVIPHNENVFMASSCLQGQNVGRCITDVNINGVTYSAVSLKIMTKDGSTVRYVQNLRTTYLAPSTVPYQRTVLQFNF